MKIITYFLTFLFLLNVNLTFCQTKKDKRYLVISLTFKDKTIYNGMDLTRDMFDSISCLSLTYDTVTSKTAVDHYQGKYFLDIDTLKPSTIFSISQFAWASGWSGGDWNDSHDNGCLTNQDIIWFKNAFDKLDNFKNKGFKLFLEDIKVRVNNGQSYIAFPGFKINLKK
jgi:hypothetical protein